MQYDERIIYQISEKTITNILVEDGNGKQLLTRTRPFTDLSNGIGSSA